MKAKEIVESGYDKIYLNYHKTKNFNIWKKQAVRDFTKYLPRNAKVLDVGCGSGICAKILTSRKFRVIGIDISSGMLKFARENVPKGKFYKMDMTKIKFPNNSFDAIIAMYSIIHVPRRFHQKILYKLYKILRPDGFLLMTVGRGDNPREIEENWLGARMYFSHFDKNKNLKMIKKAGFSIIEAKTKGARGDRAVYVVAKKSTKSFSWI